MLVARSRKHYYNIKTPFPPKSRSNLPMKLCSVSYYETGQLQNGAVISEFPQQARVLNSKLTFKESPELRASDGTMES